MARVRPIDPLAAPKTTSGRAKEAAAKRSHARQLERIAARESATKVTVREKARQRRNEVRTRQRSTLAEIEAKREANLLVVQRRDEIVRARTIENEQRRAAARAQRDIERAATIQRSASSRGRSSVVSSVAGTTASTVSNPGGTNIVLLLVYVFAGLILFYLFVSKADQTSGLAARVGNWLSILSTDAPLFTKTGRTAEGEGF